MGFVSKVGFTDQAHLSHELISVTGRPPVSFARTVTRIKHGEIVK